MTDAGIPRRVLGEMTGSGQLTKIEQGIYLLDGSWEDEFYVYSLRYPKGIFSHDTALYLHGLTDATPQVFTMTFPQGYNTKSLENPMLDVRRTEAELFGLGRSSAFSPSGNTVLAYSQERTLCDILRGSEANDTGRASVACQRYCASSDKDIAALLDYAVQLRVTARVQNYLKVLL